jgi:hypothetical protein
VDLLGLIGQDAGAVGDLLDLVIRIVVVKALGDASSVEVAVEVRPWPAQVGKATIGKGLDRRDVSCFAYAWEAENRRIGAMRLSRR